MASSHQRITILLAILLHGSACKTGDSSFCEGAPYDNCKFEAGVPIPCTATDHEECSGATPVCGSSGVCVQCTATEREACSGTTPVCDNEHGNCVQCTATEREACSGTTAVCDNEHGVCVQCTAIEHEACSGTTPACDNEHGNCVQCTATEHEACSGMKPACRGYTCQGCIAHAECDSLACLADGSCADEAQVAYVQAGGSGTGCTKAAPCGTLEAGVNAVNANRPYVKVATGLVSDDKTTTIDGKTVTILADPGAKLVRSTTGDILEVRGANASVRIFDLEITSQTGINDSAVSLVPAGGTPNLSLTRVKVTGNQGRGISSAGGSLRVTQSTLSGNQGGGISVTNGTFVIVGNVFFGNGTSGGTIGGVAVSTWQSASNRLEFNSFNKNQTQITRGAAIDCVAGVFTARNNIMSENETLMNREQVGGGCTHAYSIARPGTVPPGNTNSAMDPLFTNTTTGDLHLRAGSPALRAADPNSDLTGPAARDIDGDTRVSPADIGADEAP